MRCFCLAVKRRTSHVVDPLPDQEQLSETFLEIALVAEDAHMLAHHILQAGMHGIRIFSAALEWRHGSTNLRFDLSTGWQHRRIQDITERWGAGRLLFGTNLPVYDPGGVIACLASAEIGEAERAAVAGGTLRQLLSEACLDAV